jgi:hypothetical protein
LFCGALRSEFIFFRSRYLSAFPAGVYLPPRHTKNDATSGLRVAASSILYAHEDDKSNYSCVYGDWSLSGDFPMQGFAASLGTGKSRLVAW